MALCPSPTAAIPLCRKDPVRLEGLPGLALPALNIMTDPHRRACQRLAYRQTDFYIAGDMELCVRGHYAQLRFRVAEWGSPVCLDCHITLICQMHRVRATAASQERHTDVYMEHLREVAEDGTRRYMFSVPTSIPVFVPGIIKKDRYRFILPIHDRSWVARHLRQIRDSLLLHLGARDLRHRGQFHLSADRML